MRRPQPLARCIALAAATLALLATGGPAGSDEHSPCSPTALVPAQRAADARAVVPWKPRAWLPSGAAVAAGLWVSRDPIDGTLGMPPPQDLAGMPVVNGSSGAPWTPVAIDRLADG